MATCPRGGFLETNHQCLGVWRLRVRLWITVGFGGLCGAALVGALSAVVYGNASVLALAIGALLGCVVSIVYFRGD